MGPAKADEAYPAGISDKQLREPTKQVPIAASFENVTLELETLDKEISVLADKLLVVSNITPMTDGENKAAESESKSPYREMIDLTASRIRRARRTIATLTSQLEI